MPRDDTHPNELTTAVDGPSSAPVAARPGRPEAARQKIGRFSVLQLVGAGGMGEVFAAYDPELDRRVAVKLVHRGSDEGHSRLLREAQALAKVSHPNVVAIHDVGTHDGEVFMAMEFVTGLNLRQWLRAAPRRGPDVLERFLQAGEGLQAVHAAGLLHRDVKPKSDLRPSLPPPGPRNAADSTISGW